MTAVVDGVEMELTVSTIDCLKARGMNQSDIARLFGVSRQAVSWHKHTYNGILTPREQMLGRFPWKVADHHTRASVYRRLRDHTEYVATGGKGMSGDKLSRLRGLYNTLWENNVVVEFDPAIPPQPGFAKFGGWALRPRTAADGDLMIRVNGYTHLDDTNRRVWTMPSRHAPIPALQTKHTQLNVRKEA